MMRTLMTITALLALTAGAAADTFTATIVLPDGALMLPGNTVPVEVHGLLAGGAQASDGLAYFSVDLTLTGPQTIHLPGALTLAAPADGSMDSFFGPLGMAASYGGLPSGDDLIYAGGAQNTFGNNPSEEPFLPFPAAELITFYIAQTDQLLLEGTLAIPPEVPVGIYTLALQNLRANVLRDGQRLESFGRYGVDSATAVGDSVTLYIGADADVDGDGLVNAADLALLLGSWGPTDPCPPYANTDLNLDCDVDATDLAILLGYWGL